MSQYLIIYDNEVYMQDADSYWAALNDLSAELQVDRSELVLECPALERERRQFESGPIHWLDISLFFGSLGLWNHKL